MEGYVNSMTWQQKTKYHLENGTYTICKVILAGKVTYELWQRKNGIAEVIARGSLDELKRKDEKEKQNESM
jgi:hypothetical protein